MTIILCNKLVEDKIGLFEVAKAGLSADYPGLSLKRGCPFRNFCVTSQVI